MYYIGYQTCSHILIFLKFILSFKAEDGALLGKIEKVRVLRNDRREGRLNLRKVRYKFHSAALSVNLYQVFSGKILLYIPYWRGNFHFVNQLTGGRN